MSRKNRVFRKGEELILDITDIAFGGKGIAKVTTEKGEFTVFVPNTFTGQKVKAKVSKSQKQFAECKLMEVLEHSKDEIPVDFQIIPGAPYITLPIEKQKEFKKRTTFDLFRKIGKVDDIEDLFDEYIESPEIYHYRNKMEYSFSEIGYDLKEKTDVDEFSLGFKHRGTWWMVESLDKDSGIFDEEFENHLKDIKNYLIKTGFPAWHPPKKEGFFRHLVVRKSFTSNQLLLNLVTSETNLKEFDIQAFIDYLISLFGDRIAGVLHTINTHVGDRVEPSADSTTLIYGDSKINENINGLSFEISISSFFQTNPKCAELLYSKVVEYAAEESNPEDYIMDMFCGTGTIAQLLARNTKNRVVGVDIIESAIADAKSNAERNKVDNVDFYAADVGKFLLEYPDYNGKIGTIVLDPPRAGISPKSLTKIMALDAKRIVYVSCNPATQARDTEILRNDGWILKKISFVDQFPHTSHIESVILFEK